MFYPGQRVVCVDDSLQPHTIAELSQDVPNWVKKDTIYTVREFLDNNGIAPALLLEEVYNRPLFFRLLGRPQEPGFATWRFAPAVEETIFMEISETVEA